MAIASVAGPSPDFAWLVLDQAPFPIELLGENSEAIYSNPCCRTMFGVGPDSDLPPVVFPAVSPDGRSRQEIFQEALRERIWKGEVTLPTTSGRPFPARVTIHPVTSGSTLNFAIFYEDILTEIEERQTVAQQQNLVAMRSRQAQTGGLLSMIAHQWRQPLTVVSSLIGNVQLKLQMGKVDDHYLSAKLDRMAETIHVLSETIDSFRNFYAPTKYKTEEDLNVLVRRALDLVMPSLVRLGARVEFDQPQVVPVARIFAGEFMQVALELLNNARDALMNGNRQGPCLSLVLTYEDRVAKLRISNNGGEIPADVLPHIYDPYYTTKDLPMGSGLGLYMIKLIVESHHGGHLTASSQEGWTTFECTFPLDGTP